MTQTLKDGLYNLRKDLLTLASGKKINQVGVPFWTLSEKNTKKPFHQE